MSYHKKHPTAGSIGR